VEIEYRVDGVRNERSLLLIGGLGSQIVTVPEPLIQTLVERGYRVIRFDNRDAGLSEKTTGPPPNPLLAMMARSTGATTEPPPYLVEDMAADAHAVLEATGTESAHVVGISMGGMIAQSLAIDRPDRVLTLASVMSTTGNTAVGLPDPAVLLALNGLSGGPVEQSVEMFRLIAGPLFDEAHSRAIAEREVARVHHPVGVAFQTVAVLASADRTEALGSVRVPALVVHGRCDPLIGVSGGEATASALPNARALIIDEMGHDLPPVLWADLIEAMANLHQQ